MIRIVDILKKASDQEPGKPEKPSEPPKQEDNLPFAENLLKTVKVLLTKKESPEALDRFLALIGNLADQPLLGKSPELIDYFSRQPIEEKPAIGTVKTIISAVNLGFDANYNRQQLIGLGIAALNQLTGRNTNIIDEGNKKIIDLAVLYESTKAD